MKRMDGGSRVEGGYYWNLGNWEVVTVEGDAGVLPGAAQDKFIKIPTAALFAVAPAMGGLFVFFLPFIGFAMAFQEVGRRTVAMVRGATADLATAVEPGWRPGEAYLAGKEARDGQAAPHSDETAALDKLEAEVAARRGAEQK